MKNKLLYAAVAGMSLCISATASAEPPPWARHRGWEDRHHHRTRVYDDYYYYGGYYQQPPMVVMQVPETAYIPPSQPLNLSGPTFQNENGQYCREYQAQINISGRIRNSYGTACQQPDGQWRVIN